MPVTAIEVVADGTVVWREENAADARSGTVRTSIDASVGWVAARAWGRTRNSYDHALWAHTSPVYVRDAPASAILVTAAAGFIEDIDRSLDWMATQAQFDATSQRERIVDLFREGRRLYERLATG